MTTTGRAGRTRRNSASALQAVHSRHGDVEDDDVEILVLRDEANASSASPT